MAFENLAHPRYTIIDNDDALARLAEQSKYK